MQDLEDFQKSRWGFLADSVIDYEYTSETAVTTGEEVMIIYFSINQITSKYLLDKENIFDFREYELHGKDDYNWLWDLAFVKDKIIYFASCTHEKFYDIDEQVYKKYYCTHTN